MVNHFNDFKRIYFNNSYRVNEGHIVLHKSDGKKHNNLINNICLELLYEPNVRFVTQQRFKTGSRPDIFFVRGMHPFIIEVRDSETKEKSDSKLEKLPEELRDCVIYVDVGMRKREWLKLIS
jgi:hypothetical protein